MTASQIGTAHSKMSTNVSGTEVLRMKSVRSSITVFDLESDEFQIPLFAGDSNDAKTNKFHIYFSSVGESVGDKTS